MRKLYIGFLEVKIIFTSDQEDWARVLGCAENLFDAEFNNLIGDSRNFKVNSVQSVHHIPSHLENAEVEWIGGKTILAREFFKEQERQNRFQEYLKLKAEFEPEVTGPQGPQGIRGT